MTSRMKRLINLFMILLGVYLVISWGLTKRNIVIYQDEHIRLHARIPFRFVAGFMINFRSKILLSSPSVRTNISLLCNMFERPMFYFFSPAKNTLFVVYNRDVGFLFLSMRYQPNEQQFDFASDKPLQRAITSHRSAFTVNRSTQEELRYLLSEVRVLPPERYIQLSVPTVDMGFYKNYRPQERMISLLEWKISTLQAGTDE